MNSLYRNILFLIAGVTLLFTACEKDQIEPLYHQGVIKGTTFYYDETVFHGGPQPLDQVTVIARGPYGSKTAVTDTNGKFEISNLPNGTYEIEYTRKGWGAAKFYSAQIYGNDVIDCSQRMFKRPDFAMPALSMSEGMHFRSNLSSETNDIPYLRAFISRTSDVSCFKYDYSSGGESYVRDELIYYGFNRWYYYEEHGYVIIYVAAYEDQGYYTWDYNLGLETFPSIDPRKHSKVFKF